MAALIVAAPSLSVISMALPLVVVVSAAVADATTCASAAATRAALKPSSPPGTAGSPPPVTTSADTPSGRCRVRGSSCTIVGATTPTADEEVDEEQVGTDTSPRGAEVMVEPDDM